MLRRITSVILTVSFFILSISGVLMMFSKQFAGTLRMQPLHELFALVMVISGIIHFIFNFKTFVAYLQKRKVAVVFTALVAVVAVLYIFLMNMEMPQRGQRPGELSNTSGVQSQLPE